MDKSILAIKMNKALLIIGIVILALISVFIFAVPIPYTAVEGYNEQEPYIDIEKYTEREPYTDSVCHYENIVYEIEFGNNYPTCINEECDSYSTYCYEKNFWGNCIEYKQRCQDYKCIKYKRYCDITIQNKERDNARFELELLKWDYDEKKSEVIESKIIIVQPFESEEVSWDFTYPATESMGCWYYVIDRPQRRECENVIKYRNIQKEREVTKYRPVYKTKSVTLRDNLFNQWTGKAKRYYEVNIPLIE